MGNDFRRGQTADAPAQRQVSTARVTEEKTGGKLIASAGGVDHLDDPLGIDHMNLIAGDDYRSLFRPGQRGDRTIFARVLQGRIEIIDLVEG